MHVKLTSGSVQQFPYSLGHLRRDNPNTSFPKQISEDMLASYEVFKVQNAAKPDYNTDTQFLQSDDAPTLVDGSWVLGFTVVNKSQAAAEECIRMKRDGLLQETDWWAVSDRTMTAEQTAYRQALRDTPSQSGFPFSVTWPTKL